MCKNLLKCSQYKNDAFQLKNFFCLKLGVYFCTDKFWDFFRLKKFWDFCRLKGCWSCLFAFASKIIRHIMYMIKTYFVKIQSQNLEHNHKLLIVPKISFQMILETSSQKWFCFSLKFFDSEKSQNSESLQIYWANAWEKSLKSILLKERYNNNYCLSNDCN